MQKRLLPSEYVYREEVFPLIIIGVAINLAGSYLIEAAKNAHASNPDAYFSLAMLWQDTGGTAFVALALGPWWAAMAGVISSTLNTFMSPHFGDAFAYATVNVGLGLAWGYVGRIVNSDAVLIAPKVTALGWRAVGAGLALLFAGVVAATVVSDAVKLSLLVRAGGDLLQGQPLYIGAEKFFRHFGLASGARYLALFTVDFYENIFDKGLSLAVALVLVNAMGVIPSSQTRGTHMRPLKLTERLRVSGDSVVCFAATYAMYLFMGRLILQRVHFEYSPVNAGIENWMKPAGAVLLSSFVIAYLAFVFGTLKNSRETDSVIDANRLDRMELYGRIRKPKPWSRSSIEKSQVFSLFQKNSVYGVVISLAGWPAKSHMSDSLSVWIYFFGMLGLSSIFFFDRRDAMELFRKALAWRTALRERLTALTGTNNQESVIPLFLEIAGAVFTPALGGLQRQGQIFYQLAINTATSGWLYEMRSFKEIDHLLLVATQGRDNLDEAGCEFVAKIIEAIGVEAAIVISSSIDGACIAQLHKLGRTSNSYLIVLDAADLQDMIETRAQNMDVGLVFARRRVESRFVPVLHY